MKKEGRVRLLVEFKEFAIMGRGAVGREFLVAVTERVVL